MHRIPSLLDQRHMSLSALMMALLSASTSSTIMPRTVLPACVHHIYEELALLCIIIATSASVCAVVALKITSKIRAHREYLEKQEKNMSLAATGSAGASGVTRESGEGEEFMCHAGEASATDPVEMMSPSPTLTVTDEDDHLDDHLESMSSLFKKNWKKEIVDSMYSKCLFKLNEDPNKVSLSGIAIVSDDLEELIDIPVIATSPRSSSTVSSRFNCLPRISLKDVRSLTLTRRSFLRFIYEEMSTLISSGMKRGIVIERRPDGHGFRKRSGVKIVLYFNHSIVDMIEQEESERSKNRMRPTSYSNTLVDKLAIWSLVGVQGAILSHLLEPLYIDSILVSSRTRASRLTSIITGKINQLTSVPIDSSRGFAFNMPSVDGTGIPRAAATAAATSTRSNRGYSSSSLAPLAAQAIASSSSSPVISLPYYYHHRPPSPSPSASPNPYTSSYDRLICLNYISTLDSIEAIYSDTGATIAGKSSRICKASLFDLFASLSFARTLPKLTWSPFTAAYPLSYVRVKSQAIPYQVMKAQVLDRMKKDARIKSSSASSSASFTRSTGDNFYAFDPK